MAKKQAQFRFDEDFYADLQDLAGMEGMTISEIVRNAIKLYAALYKRSKGKNVRLYLESEADEEPKCEVILPWLP